MQIQEQADNKQKKRAFAVTKTKLKAKYCMQIKKKIQNVKNQKTQKKQQPRNQDKKQDGDTG